MKTGNRRVWIHLYQERGGRDWRWRMKSRNGKVIAAATEGFRKRKRALENLHLVTGVRWHLPPFEKGPHFIHVWLSRGEY